LAAPLSGDEQASFGGAGNGMFISSDSEAKDAAWEFIAFMLEPENVKEYTLTVGGIPARASLADDPELADVPYLAPFMDATEHFQGNPNVPAWTQLRDVLSKNIEAALHGATDPKAALDAAADEAAPLLEDGS
jgi:multiple sugar transport system substrate-binding protein